MPTYQEEDFLQLSGIQHFAFCQRQWALIYLEDAWSENYLTAKGRLLHEKAHEGKVEKRGGLITVRALKIASQTLGLSGECDVVEFLANKDGVFIRDWNDYFLVRPVEYKHGKPKIDDCDRLQLCAQAICLEEMLCCEIGEGALFYGQPRRREQVLFDTKLRQKVKDTAEKMHALYKQQHTPLVKSTKHCFSCSLKEQCLPKLLEQKQKSVQKYLEDALL